jgi:flagellar basal body rod protein FlgG
MTRERLCSPSARVQEVTGHNLANVSTDASKADAVTVRQGSVEEPSSDSALGPIDLVTIQRAYAANIDALKAMDGVLATVAGEALNGQLSHHLPKE